jgi:AraC-like DNA-binding protein
MYNHRLLEAKKKRNKAIRDAFEKMVIERNLQFDYAIQLLVDEYGLSESTIYSIIKRYGYYADK